MHKSVEFMAKWCKSIIPTLTLSRITSGPATPETVLYSVYIQSLKVQNNINLSHKHDNIIIYDNILSIFSMVEYIQKLWRFNNFTHANLECPLVHVEFVFSTHIRLNRIMKLIKQAAYLNKVSIHTLCTQQNSKTHMFCLSML